MESVQAIAESLALRLGRSVAIDDAQRKLLAHTAREEPVDSYRIQSVRRRTAGPVGPTLTDFALRLGNATATEPVRVPTSAELESLPRICVPVCCQNTLLGYWWLMDFEPGLTGAELELASRAADAAGEAIRAAVPNGRVGRVHVVHLDADVGGDRAGPVVGHDADLRRRTGR